jgi:hypothetical protein
MEKDLGARHLIYESEWIRIFEWEGGGRLHESKFLTQGLSVSAESIKQRWSQLTQDQRCEFALAFQAKPLMTSNDEEILDFLMARADHVVWAMICPLLPRRRNRELVLKFLLDRISAPEIPKSNFYQAIEALGDNRALPLLRDAYAKYGEALNNHALTGKIDRLDFLQCCRALWTLEGSSEYEQRLRSFLSSDDEDVRSWAKRFLVQQ